MSATATKPDPGRQLARVAPEHHLAQADPEELGALLARSNYFQDATDAAKAAVKILAGRELGISPIAAMTDVHIIDGKPSLGGNLLAGLVKGSEKYDYRPRQIGETECVLAAFEGGEEVAEVTFTIEDATRAGLTTKDVWKKYPRNMLFNRAISNLIAWYAPDLTIGGGRIYTPEELGARVDATGEPIVDADGTVEMDPQAQVQHLDTAGPEPQAAAPQPTRPLLNGSQKSKVAKMAKASAVDGNELDAVLFYFGGSHLPDRIEARYAQAVYEALGNPAGALAYITERAEGEGDEVDARARKAIDRWLTPADSGGGTGEDAEPVQGELV